MRVVCGDGAVLWICFCLGIFIFEVEIFHILCEIFNFFIENIDIFEKYRVFHRNAKIFNENNITIGQHHGRQRKYFVKISHENFHVTKISNTRE